MFNNKKIHLALVFLTATILAGCTHQQGGEGVAESTTQPQDTNQVEVANKTFSLEEVAKHATPDDCWLILDRKVYEVTEFIPTHPGGKAILEGCGKDATQLFETRPMGSGVSHSSKARNISQQYYIGDLE